MKTSRFSTRRNFLRAMAATAALAPAAVLLRNVATAAELTPLSEEEPAAKALQYLNDAKKSKDPSRTCASCSLFQGDGKAVQGPCSLFAGKLVKAAGTCNGWAPQM